MVPAEGQVAFFGVLYNNGQMFRDEKDMQNSLKDTGTGLGIAIKDASAPISYNKINKLITALYMVTDIMDIGRGNFIGHHINVKVEP